ncbi:hypothetical protein VTJ83DRAFT_6519 [Remersonia thermophila]|uniref:Uncharacterized protein n=1 Tax=Remersonia thermophila TaxID=72144 RepID=A0ABR4D4Y1_9PEZI
MVNYMQLPSGWKPADVIEQPYLTMRHGAWQPAQEHMPSAAPALGTNIRFSVLTWNLDARRPELDARIDSILLQLRIMVENCPVLILPVIMLSEVTPPCLERLRQTLWVKMHFNISDTAASPPASGTLMLIPRLFPIKTVYRVPCGVTKGGTPRDLLFVDVALTNRNSSAAAEAGERVFRLCTAHLAGLFPRQRAKVLAKAAAHLRLAHLGVLGGDLHAVTAWDAAAAAENRLRDAFLEQGGVERDKEAATFGPTADLRDVRAIGPHRTDKILFCGHATVLCYDTFGKKAVVSDPWAQRELLEHGRLARPWASDHLGVEAVFAVKQDEGEEGEWIVDDDDDDDDDDEDEDGGEQGNEGQPGWIGDEEEEHEEDEDEDEDGEEMGEWIVDDEVDGNELYYPMLSEEGWM